MKRVGRLGFQHFFCVGLLAGFLAALSACKKAPVPVKGGPGGGKGGGFSIQVVAVPVRQQPVIESVALVGSVTANEFVEIKAEGDGLSVAIKDKPVEPLVKVLVTQMDPALNGLYLRLATTLRQAGINKVRMGITSLEEVNRVTVD